MIFKISGLFIGLLFGFLLKRGRFCPTGTIRDIYLEKKYYNAVLILAVIATEGVLYHLLVGSGVSTTPFFGCYSLIAVPIGGFIFGIGAVMTNGCITSTLVKVGDGRIIGILSLIVFAITEFFTNKWVFKPFTQKLMGFKEVYDIDLFDMPISPLIVFVPLVVVLYVVMIRHYRSHKPKYKLPQRYAGLRHVFCEKIWSREVTVVLIGIVMGTAFYFSNLTDRNGGISISDPVLSWFNMITHTHSEPIG